MAILFHQPWPTVKRLAALAVLTLGWSGCAIFEEITPSEWVERPLQEAKVHEAAPAVSPIPQSGPALTDEPARDLEVIKEVRTPLKKLLLSVPETPNQRYVIQRGDTLGAIARRHGVTLLMLKSVNGLDTDRIRAGQRLVIPNAALRIEIDKSENLLRLFRGPELIRAYPVATGDQGITPTGRYTIANRLIQPTWYWQGYAVTPDDPEYPLGSRWLGLSRRGYGIHGTNEPESIGQQVSHGCIRMHNEDVEELFDVVSVGTTVTITE